MYSNNMLKWECCVEHLHYLNSEYVICGVELRAMHYSVVEYLNLFHSHRLFRVTRNQHIYSIYYLIRCSRKKNHFYFFSGYRNLIYSYGKSYDNFRFVALRKITLSIATYTVNTFSKDFAEEFHKHKCNRSEKTSSKNDVYTLEFF